MIPLRVLVKLKGKTTNLGPHVQFIPQQPNFDQTQTQLTLPGSPLATVPLSIQFYFKYLKV